MPDTLKLFRMTDEQLLRALVAIAEKGNIGPNARARLKFSERAQQLDIPLEDVLQNANVRRVLAANAAVFSYLSVGGDRASVSVTRQQGFDDLAISPPHNAPPEEQLPFVLAVHEHLKTVDSQESVSRMLGDELAHFYADREKGLIRLEELAETIIRKTEDYRARLDSERDEFKRTCQAMFDEKEVTRSREHAARLAEVEERRQALAKREQEFDDRTSRHARRGHHKDLKNTLEARSRSFSLTKSTRQKRIVLHATFAAMIGVTAAVLWFGLFPSIVPTDPWVQPLKIALGAAGLVGALIYYTRWNDQWFRQHADEELRLKRMELDIDRASWLVEMALEWKEQKGGEIPEELLDRLSRNLFHDSSMGALVRHPAEDFYSTLLGSASGLKVKVPFGEASFDRKGLSKIQADQPRDESS